MSRVCFSMSRVIPAIPAQVFHLLDDYQNGHWRVLPPAFSSYRVLAGGFGEGTRIAFRLTTGGRTSSTEGVVTVPDPGRVIVETYPKEQMVTTFTVDPEGDGARLAIATSIPARTPLTAPLEKCVLRRLLEPIYTEEFALIAQWAPYWYE
ncbi:MAG: SRPBCC family protein [Thermomicrobiales bacterium]|nr:SRPBCC family protein [Thermomicrobiales bacterium]